MNLNMTGFRCFSKNFVSLCFRRKWSIRRVNPSNAEATFVQSTRAEFFWKPSKPCHVGIHWITLTEFHQMSTHMPGFHTFFRVFCTILLQAKLATSSIRVNLLR